MNTFRGKAEEKMRATWQEQTQCKKGKLGHGVAQATKKLVIQVAFAKSRSEGGSIFCRNDRVGCIDCKVEAVCKERGQPGRVWQKKLASNTEQLCKSRP
jgi:hypothetical protein